MRTIDFTNVTLWLGVAVFVVLLVVQHDSLAEAALRAAPLAVFALLGAFGAAMTRYLVRSRADAFSGREDPRLLACHCGASSAPGQSRRSDG